eukprot:scaffold35268_cov36-Cyclotella_meneghiniana.AAC.2
MVLNSSAMAKYWPPTESQYTQHQNKAAILPPSEAVLSETFVVHSQTVTGSAQELAIAAVISIEHPPLERWAC